MINSVFRYAARVVRKREVTQETGRNRVMSEYAVIQPECHDYPPRLGLNHDAISTHVSFLRRTMAT